MKVLNEFVGAIKEWRKRRIIRALRKEQNVYGHRLLKKLMEIEGIPEEERYLRIIDICAEYHLDMVIPN